MAAAFGFSVGDVLAVVNLVSTVIDSLRSASGSGSQYRDLVSELQTLKDSLIHVKHVALNETQDVGQNALLAAVAQCQQTVDEFVKKIEPYQPYLATGGSGNKAKDAWMKIKWATCKREDIETFRQKLRDRRGVIEVLLTSLQVNHASRQTRAQVGWLRSLCSKIQELSVQCMGRLAVISDNVTICVEQGKKLMNSTARVLDTNNQILQLIYTFQWLTNQVPPQIDRQQPVYMIDALGRASPFHLEFVRSAEALTAVLKINFQHTRSGIEKIERGEFVILESGSQQDVDLRKPWDTCFFPGQRVAMSIVVNSNLDFMTNWCPICKTATQNATRMEILCATCGRTFSRVRDMHSQDVERPMIEAAPAETETLNSPSVQDCVPLAGPPLPETQLAHKTDHGVDDGIRDFRRIRIQGSAQLSTSCTYLATRGSEIMSFAYGSCHVGRTNDDTWIEFVMDESPETDPEVHLRILLAPTQSFRRSDKLIIWLFDQSDVFAFHFNNSQGYQIIRQILEETYGKIQHLEIRPHPEFGYAVGDEPLPLGTGINEADEFKIAHLPSGFEFRTRRQVLHSLLGM